MEESIILAITNEQAPSQLLDGLQRTPYHFDIVSSAEDAWTRLDEGSYSHALIDIRQSPEKYMEVLQKLASLHPEIETIIVLNDESAENVVEAVRRGVISVLTEPFTAEHISDVLNRALSSEAQAREATQQYEEHLAQGIASLEAENLEAAEEHARRAMARVPTRPEAFNLLGVVMQVTAHWQEARKYYQVALALDPGYEPARRNQENLSSPPPRRDPGKHWVK